ncbi:4'-phosphopantetheinyl transferase superfamily protein [Synechocystis sp. LKSZ1]|uniref:4'-phosphopantetheinyl transferase family protein n=1 Tax=Synechocystis sp. LKSZ1 TaxID=3144951 RepID=UPI00336BCDF9
MSQAILQALPALGLHQHSLTPRDLAPISLWYLPLPQTLNPEGLAQLETYLSPLEKQRAEALSAPQQRQRYRWVRGTLRLLLAQHLGCSPPEVCLSYGPKGKPGLDPQIHPQALQFNLSHAQDWAVIALTENPGIGIDLEYLPRVAKVKALARRFFAPCEVQALYQLPQVEQHQYFFQLWTAKEAYLKTIGQGLSGGLNRVILDPSAQAYQHLPEDSRPWRLLSFPFQENYWVAIAVLAGTSRARARGTPG